MSTMYLPPEGIYFRLKNFKCGDVLVSRDDGVSGYHDGQPYDDQFFTTIHGTGDRSGLVAFKSKAVDKVLYCRGDGVGNIDGDGKYDDKYVGSSHLSYASANGYSPSYCTQLVPGSRG